MGFSLLELLIAVTVLLVVSSAVTSGLLQLTNSHRTIANRTEMHGGVRSATELLQQEVGQAGRAALPAPTTLAGAVGVGAATVGINQTVGTVTAASVSGIFQGELLTIDTGELQETVAVTSVDTAGKQITATFANAHVPGTPVNVFGGFATGIVPPQPGYANGSTGTVLKLFGDINGDGNMVYIEYTCDANNGYLYRNMMPFDATVKPAVTSSQVLLSNITSNPGGTACFTYMPNPLPVVTVNGNSNTFVLDVAITLTVKSQFKEQTTNDYEKETKALLNVSPRNVFNAWQFASAGGVLVNRVQPIPLTLRDNLLP